ncbi:MAG: T9SS type A sorting domain-containing protein, partial [Bacteroidales bacterium]|nr:T9SS type A sorting domain-containing protein [Bacteroidales bacterium]
QYNWEQVTLPDTIGAGTICFYGNDIYLATGNGVYHSNDHCASWEYIGLGQYPIWSIHVSTSGNLFAGTGSGIFKYEGNNSWDLLYITEEASNIISIYESENGYIFFGNFGGIFRSTDGGVSWTEVLDLSNTESVESITGNTSGSLFAGSISYNGDVSPGGIYKSDDGGSTWYLAGLNYHFVSSIVTTSENEIYAGTKGHWTMGTGRIYKSVDDGQTWNIVLYNHYILSLSINEYDEVAAASENGIFSTYDNGMTWNEVTPNWTGKYFQGVAFHPEGQLYAVSYFVYADLFRTLEPVTIYENIAQHEVVFYPNPATNKLFIKTEDIESFKELNIYDCLWKNVLHKEIQSNMIDISSVKQGMYVIEFVTNGSKLRQKLLIN